MFNDLNLIVERQGEQIDKIEDLINNTQDFMEKGIKQLICKKTSKCKSNGYASC